MSVPSPASRQVALLIAITVLFAVVWSTDSGHRDEPAAPSPSAIAILMQSTAVESPTIDTTGWAPEPKIEMQCGQALEVASTCPPMTYYVSVELEPVAICEKALLAPVPQVVDGPVAAPVPDVLPVMAPLPPAPVASLAEWSGTVPVIETAAKRVRMDYLMTCHCCREYCGTSARRIAVLKRQARDMMRSLATTIARTANGIDWKTRLSTVPDGDDSTRRY